MFGRRRDSMKGMGQNWGVWPVLLVVLISALVPIACVLWFMNAAMRNERLAVRQRLADAYHQRIEQAQHDITVFWQQRMIDDATLAMLSSQPSDDPSRRHDNSDGVHDNAARWHTFRRLVASGKMDSVILLDESGRTIFPDTTVPKAIDPSASPEAWRTAQRLEFEEKAFEAAATAYAEVAAQMPEPNEHDWRAQALLGQARCWAKLGQFDRALPKLLHEMSQPERLAARDPWGRSVWLDSQLFAIETMQRNHQQRSNQQDGDPQHSNHQAQQQIRFLMALLIGNGDVSGNVDGDVGGNAAMWPTSAPATQPSATDVQVPATRPSIAEVQAVVDAIPFAQRMAAMKWLASISGQVVNGNDNITSLSSSEGLQASSTLWTSFYRLLTACELAGRYLDTPQSPAEKMRLTPSALPGLWHMTSRDGRIVSLFDEVPLIADLIAAGRLNEPFAGPKTQLRLELPGRGDPNHEPFLTGPISDQLPGWRLAIYLDQDPFATFSARAESHYLIVGISATAIIAALALLMASYLGRQIKLTRLKNDLIATVSHELKTPLASMRVLVDTLREGRSVNEQQTQDYFELISKENERLSRLIDNFLTFSRMERNKRAFEFSLVHVGEVVNEAARAVRDRFALPGSQLHVD
ncbi:MAG: hypothetical protein FWC56_01970, partial [Phycisphaerae bacterium]|nr:hypothetical protein [Phycisphaerae bacterium]